MYTYLQHGIAVGVWNVNLQSSKLGVIVVTKIKCLNS